MEMKVINPATEEVLADLIEDNEESLKTKLDKLRAAQPEWATLSIEQRVDTIQRFAAFIGKEKESLAAILTSEVGKPLQQSRNEIDGAIRRINWLSANASIYLSEEWMTDADGMKEKISYEPLGVICNISAWNYPWLVGVNVFVPALIAGNAVMYKPSEYSSLTGMEIQKALIAAGVPLEVFQLAVGGAAVGKSLLEMNFDGYFFTGSYRTGKQIYETVAHKMVPCQLELGGKDPLYVADDVNDIASVAAGTADGAFYNNGQSCCAVERIYVNEKVYDQYVESFLKEVSSYKTGEPVEPGVYIGPLTRNEQLKVLEEQVADALSKGATLAAGGKRMNRRGYYFEPTVLLNVTNDMRVMQEESFGPIIGIMKVNDDQEALAKMKDTEYGLTASVYSSSRERAEKILSALDAGTGYWNCCDRVSAAVPWSGRKHSGFGATLSHIGLRAFTKPKAWHLRGN